MLITGILRSLLKPNRSYPCFIMYDKKHLDIPVLLRDR